VIDRGTVLRMLDEELAALGAESPWASLEDIRALFERTALAGELPLFFTPDAYTRHLVHRTEPLS
jgi:malate synthase